MSTTSVSMVHSSYHAQKQAAHELNPGVSFFMITVRHGTVGIHGEHILPGSKVYSFLWWVGETCNLGNKEVGKVLL